MQSGRDTMSPEQFDPPVAPSTQRLHHDLSVRGSPRKRVEPPLHVGLVRAFDRHGHPAPDAATEHDVAHRQGIAGQIRAGCEMGVHDPENFGGLEAGIFERL